MLIFTILFCQKNPRKNSEHKSFHNNWSKGFKIVYKNAKVYLYVGCNRFPKITTSDVHCTGQEIKQTKSNIWNICSKFNWIHQVQERDPGWQNRVNDVHLCQTNEQRFSLYSNMGQKGMKLWVWFSNMEIMKWLMNSFIQSVLYDQDWLEFLSKF